MSLSNLKNEVDIKLCPNCLRMRNSRPAFSVNSASAGVMFIAEAPGIHGAHVGGIPLHGDKTGDNFEGLLESIGLSRKDVYITNAVLCMPQDKDGKMRPPKDSEIKNCSSFLFRQIETIQPKIIVTLGAKALKGLHYIRRHDLKLPGLGQSAKVTLWNGRSVLPLYHPSPLVVASRRTIAHQLADFQILKEWLLDN